MRRVIWIFLLIVISAATSAKTVIPIEEPLPAIDPNAVLLEKQAVEIEQMVKELPVKEQELKEKEYTGTVVDVFSQYIADSNDILVYAQTMVSKSKDYCEKMKFVPVIPDDPNSIRPQKWDFVKLVVERHGKVEEKEAQKNTYIFLKEAVPIISDPNSLPEPTDPNYVDELDRRNQLLAAIFEICNPR